MTRPRKALLVILALLAFAGWFQIWGRWEYHWGGSRLYRIDRLTGRARQCPTGPWGRQWDIVDVLGLR